MTPGMDHSVNASRLNRVSPLVFPTALMLSAALLLILLLPIQANAQEHSHGADLDPHPPGETIEANTTCPVTPGEPVNPNISIQHDGRQVFFCCNSCKRQFLQDPQKYVSNPPDSIAGEAEHSHELDHGSSTHHSTRDRVVQFAGKFHPLSVHFPIALLISALLFEGIGFIYPHRRYRDTSRLLVNLSAPMTVFAAALGWAAGKYSNFPSEMDQVLSSHRLSGSITVVLAVASLVFLELSIRKRSDALRTAYLSALFLSVLFVGISGHLGGTLVFGDDYFIW